MKEDEKIVLSALLHDIGKFWQRTGESRNHAELGSKFIADFVPKNILKEYDSLIVLVKRHHGSFEHQTKDFSSNYQDLDKFKIKDIITLKGYIDLKKLIIADWLSSGEREDLEGEEEGKPKITPLISVFSQIKLKNSSKENDDKNEVEYCYRLNPLSTSKESIFPVSKDFKLSKEEYKDLWDNFVTEIRNIKSITNFSEYFNKIFYILQKYTWCIPSAVYKSRPDVSLFDHLKTTCAIACCLYNSNEIYLNNIMTAFSEYWKIKRDMQRKYLNENELEKEWKQWIEEQRETGQQINNSFEEPKFSLIHGDISGIQKFIYNIKTKHAAKSLKGRSLFLVFMTRFVSEHILKKLGLPITNLLFCGGGHFYILSYKIDEKNLTEIRKEINEELFKEFKTNLYLAIGKIDLCAKNFVNGSIVKKWEEVSKATGKQKLKRYKEFGNTAFNDLFMPFDGRYKEICSICGNEINKSERLIETGSEQDWCKVCKTFKKFAEYLKESQKEGKIVISDIKNLFNFLNNFNLLYNGIYFTTTKNIPFMNVPLGIPINNGAIKTFEKLANDWEKERVEGKHIGDAKLGILRMDVDNLGKIFAKGLGNRATISRMSNLSRMLSLFFEGYLNTLIENEKYRNYIYLIYAGGDDTFIVGRWDKVIDIAYNIYKDFRGYTCENKDITISAGVVITDPKYPIRKSANKSEEMLEKAKDKGKNRIGIFNEVLKWGNEDVDEFNEVIELRNKLIDLIDKGANKQILQRIKDFYKNMGSEISERRYIRGLKYYFYRNYFKREHPQTELWEKINELIKKFDKLENLYKDKYNITYIVIAARLAELQIREDKNEI